MVGVGDLYRVMRGCACYTVTMNAAAPVVKAANENRPIPDPASVPRVTPLVRQGLQDLFAQARQQAALAIPNHQRIHELLAQCVAADPGNTIFIEALLANLRQRDPRLSWRALFAGWFSSDPAAKVQDAAQRGQWSEVLRGGPAALWKNPQDTAVLRSLAAACAAADFPQAEESYLSAALAMNDLDPLTHRQRAYALTRRGHFDAAAGAWQELLRVAPGDEEARRLLARLREESALPSETDLSSRQNLAELQAAIKTAPGDVAGYLNLASVLVSQQAFDDAERLLSQAQAIAGGDLQIRAEREEIQLARLRRQVRIARQLVSESPEMLTAEVVGQWQAELNRLELAVLNARCERFPNDATLKLEVAIRLKRSGNYSGAIQHLGEVVALPIVRAVALYELGECWQHLRQFDKALAHYQMALALLSARAANDAAPPTNRELLERALYQAGVLSAALGNDPAARDYFRELAIVNPHNKDAARRLDKLAPICDKV